MSFQKHTLFIISVFLLIANFTSKLHAEVVRSSVSDSTQTHYLAPTHLAITDSIINYGKIFLDRPYRYGSPGDTTFDCSGFTSYVYRNFGYNLQRSSAEQAQQFDTVGRTRLKAGDLVFFSGSRRSKRVGHVGIVVTAKEDGNFDFIHASVQKGVTISSSTESYYSRRYIKANRVIAENALLAIVPGFSANPNINTPIDNTFPVNTPIKQSTKTIPAKYHRVKRGETLSSIAENFGLSVAELKRKNGIKGSKINLKQSLKVKDEETYTVVEPVQLAKNKPEETQQNNVIQKTESPVTAASHIVKKGESLFTISKLYNITVDELRKINNNLTGSIRPSQELKLNQPTVVTEKPATAKTEPAVKTTTHKVVSGESLFSIAKMYNLPIDDLKKLNNLTVGKIKPGQIIKINQPTEAFASANEKVKPVSASKTITHKVKSGESLFLIAKNYNVSVVDLKKLNNLSDGKIKPGQEINVSQSAEIVDNATEISKAEMPEKTIKHKVRKGESLFSIAKDNNVSIEELKKLNNLTTNEIKFGQELDVKQATESIYNTKTKVETKTRSIHHKIKSGESYYSIAQKFGCSMNELKEWNRKLGSKLKIGDVLVILLKK